MRKTAVTLNEADLNQIPHHASSIPVKTLGVETGQVVPAVATIGRVCVQQPSQSFNGKIT